MNSLSGATLVVLPGGDAARAEEFASSRGWEVVAAREVSRETLSRARYPFIVLWSGRGIPPKEGELLLPWLEKGFEVVLGSRFVRGESIVQRRAERDVFCERALLWAAATLWRIPRDCLSGILAARCETLERLLGDSTPAAFEDVVGRALGLRMKIKETGVMWIPASGTKRGLSRERLSAVLKNARGA